MNRLRITAGIWVCFACVRPETGGPNTARVNTSYGKQDQQVPERTEKESKREGPANAADSAAAGSLGLSAELSAAMANHGLQLADLYLLPDMARVEVRSQVELTRDPSFYGEDFVFPTLQLKIYEAPRVDFVEIMRCSENYLFQGSLGGDLRLGGSAFNERDAMDAWRTALSGGTRCKLIAHAWNRDVFHDSTVEVGAYYYVVNPCIAAERSVLGLQGCSYRLAFTDKVYAPVSLNKTLRDAQREITEASAQLNRALYDVRALSLLLATAVEACEDRAANDLAMNAFKMGLLQLATFAVGATVGAVGGMAMGDPVGMGMMAGSMLGSMGSGLLSPMFGIVDAIPTEDCINPNAREVSETTRRRLTDQGIKDTATGRGGAKYLGKYEEMYGAAALMAQLQNYVAPGGVIENAMTEVDKALGRHTLLQACARTWNRTQRELRQAGWDPEGYDIKQASEAGGAAGILETLLGSPPTSEMSLSLTEAPSVPAEAKNCPALIRGEN